MKVEDLIVEGSKNFHKDQVRLILSTLLGINYLEIYLHLNDMVSDDLKNKFFSCLDYLKKGKPIQYALKSVNFYGIDFYIDERVLIPRFETEELVFNANNYINKYFLNNIKLLDLCSGSGCIGLTLKKLNSNLDVTLSDISKEAIEVSKINAERLNLNINTIESDMFSKIDEKYDVIISNPPYVGIDDEISDIVLNNEPHIALFAKNDGLEYYDKILSICEEYLNSKYLIAFEIGATQKDKIIDLINKYLKNVKVITKQDMSKRDRMIFIFKNIDIIE